MIEPRFVEFRFAGWNRPILLHVDRIIRITHEHERVHVHYTTGNSTDEDELADESYQELVERLVGAGLVIRRTAAVGPDDEDDPKTYPRRMGK